MTIKIALLIPTYNEAVSIVELLDQLADFRVNKASIFDVIVIDDNSPDHTADKVVMLQSEFEGRLFLEKRAKKSGLGTAYVHGFRWALERKYDFIFEMDADFSHNPTDLEKLYKSIFI